MIAGKRNNDVSFLVHEIEKLVRGEGGTEAFGFGGEEDNVVVRAFAMSEEREFVCFG